MGREQHVPELVIRPHIVAEAVFLADIDGFRQLAGFVVMPHGAVGPAVGVHQSTKALGAVDLPGEHMGKIHVIVGGAALAADENDGIAAFPGKSLRLQSVVPGLQHAIAESMQKFTRRIETG